MTPRDDRITITIETPEMPDNDTAAAHSLLTLIETLRHHGIYPSRLTLDIKPAAETT